MSKHSYESGRLNLPFVGHCTFAKSPPVLDWDRIDADIAVLGAPFGELTFEITPDLKATAGLRYVSAKTSFDFVAAGYFTVGLPTPYSESKKYSSTTPKFALDYAITRETNVYTNVSKGFRLGGPTGPDPANVPGGSCNQDYANLNIPGAPLQYDSDSLWSYEVGSKGRYLDNRLAVNAAVYATGGASCGRHRCCRRNRSRTCARLSRAGRTPCVDRP
jgi:outer membrane receptor protein involved in Fe transport